MAEQDSWHYHSPEGPKGPVSQPSIADLVAAGAISTTTLVWRPGMDGWKNAGATELSSHFPAPDLTPPPLPSGFVSASPGPAASDAAMEEKYRAIFGTTPQNATLEPSASFGAPLDLPAPPPDKPAYHYLPVPPPLGFVDAVRQSMARALDVEGRASRSEYWWFQLFMLIVLIVTAAIGSGPMLIAALALIVPAVTQSIRRMHDIGEPGWWVILSFVFLPLFYLIALQKSKPAMPTHRGAAR